MFILKREHGFAVVQAKKISGKYINSTTGVYGLTADNAQYIVVVSDNGGEAITKHK